MQLSSRLIRVAFAAAVLIEAATPISAQQPAPAPTLRPERLTGRVTSDSTHPLAGAEIIVTRGPDRLVKRDTSGSDGRWSISFAEGTGDYLVYISAAGFKPARRRMQRASDTDTLFTFNTTLAPLLEAQTIDTVQVTATRPKPTRDVDTYAAPGLNEQGPEGIYGALSPDQRGDVNALAASVPGMISTADGMSALGLSSSQNSTTLEGLGFSGASIPRDARVTTSVGTSPFDPSRGGFSGAQIALRFDGGSYLSSRTASLTVDAPALQASSALSRRLGVPYLNLSAGAGGDGIFGRKGALSYNISGQVTRRSNDAFSLFTLAPDALRANGVSPDSVRRLQGLIGTLGVPGRLTAGGSTVSQGATFLASIGGAGVDWDTYADKPVEAGVNLIASLQQTDPLGLSPFSAASLGGRSQNLSLGVQGKYSVYLDSGRTLLDLRSALSFDDRTTSAFNGAPTGIVTLASPELGDELSGVTSLGFGGSDRSNGRRSLGWQARGEYVWYQSITHRWKLTVDSKLDGIRSSRDANSNGVFRFASLADLAANRAQSFSRRLGTPDVQSGVWNGAASLGNFWRATDYFRVVYGARIEGNVYTNAPTGNPLVERLFGVHAGDTPNRVHVSPRAGFTWYYLGDKSGNAGRSFGPLGQFARGGAGQLRGGIGEWRNIMSADLLSDPVALTGLARDGSSVLCIGDAVPTPNWNGFATDASTVPTSCLAGGPNLADTTHNVALLDRHFDAPRSWRANLAWSQQRWHVAFTIDGTLSLNLNQPGNNDLNLRSSAVTSLGSEGNRPMFVPLSSIVASSGLIPLAPSREHAELGRVTSVGSDIRSVTKQLVIRLSPQLNYRRVIGASYALTGFSAQSRGFDGDGFGDPRLKETTTGTRPLHQVTLSYGEIIPHVGSVTLYSRIESPRKYSPLVEQDVNGDGLPNDRAFIQSPAAARAAGDVAMADGMQSLLASTHGSAHDCLASQLDRAARHNSCSGPWTATLNAHFGLQRQFIGTAVPTTKRLSTSLEFANVLGGLDQLIHGAGRMRGWGANAFPDRTLYSVTGFDAAKQRFRYQVNPRFGSTNPVLSALTTPFRATLLFTVNIGTPAEVQQVSRMLAPGRNGEGGTKLDSTKLAFQYRRSVPDYYKQVIELSDSLFLTRVQVEQLQDARRKYHVRADSMWGVLGGEFARLPDNYDPTAALRRQEEVIDAEWMLMRRELHFVRQVLTPLQWSLLPGIYAYLEDETKPFRVRMY
ncbi:MAG: hypothetical protein JWO05_772 [Gemmatimonadetes bacterium]|nr:hypothetical protein [Gemmatimonadota bacterium]